MYWGYSLLGAIWDDVGAAIGAVFYESLPGLLSRILYITWESLALIVDGIEKIFRNLAGLGDKGDIVSDIISNPKVDQIFRNMVGLATAVLIFFTIVKIIQDHYKEKDGGNPYKIVIRTFKGLLMFFFINAAVVVGLYASGIMFRALDAATGTGSTSVSGMIFKSMASTANRRNGTDTDRRNPFSAYKHQLWERVSSDTSKEGRLFFAGFGDAGTSNKSLDALYKEAFPYLEYEVVQDNSIIPLTKWLQTADDSNYFNELWNDYYKNGENQSPNLNDFSPWENGSVSGSVGYKNDLLCGFDLSVTPSIDLDWCPIGMRSYTYELQATRQDEVSPKISVMGNSFEIPMAIQYGHFFQTQRGDLSFEGSKKQFGITVRGKVALQDSAASASFSFSAGDVYSQKYDQILMSLLVNVAYTNIMMQLLQLIPTFPIAANVGPMAVSFVQVAAPVITTVIKTGVDMAFQEIFPKDANGNVMVEAFSDGTGNYSSGVWCVMNARSDSLITRFEQYELDSNFGDLWGNLSRNIQQNLENLTKANHKGFVAVAEGSQKMADLSKRTTQQQDWMTYMGLVNDYNKRSSTLLEKLGNLLALYDRCMNAADAGNNDETRTTWIKKEINGGYSGNWSKLNQEIQSTFLNLVSLYQNNIRDAMPANNYADVIITRPVYKPIIEFSIDENDAQGKTVSEIKDCFNTGDAKINLVLDETGSRYGSPAAYRVVDWENAYGNAYYNGDSQGTFRGEPFKDVADLYYTPQFVYNSTTQQYEEVQPQNASLVNKISDLMYLSLERVQQTSSSGTSVVKWDKNGGVRYFAQNDNWYSNAHLEDNSYWGTNAIYRDGDKVYYYYDGRTYKPLTGALNDFTLDDDYNGIVNHNSNGSANNIHVSTAALNEQMLSAQSKQDELIKQLTKGSDSGELAPELANQIVTMRKIGTSGTGADILSFKTSWLNMKDRVRATGTPSYLKMTSAMSADEIDDIMAGNNISWSGNKERMYLLITDENDTKDAQMDQSNWSSYIGSASWKNVNSVNALYWLMLFNYPVGMIAIVAALGVFMNFSFALIQRAVNMAVLYMLSPITISFYPFDDGSKFNSVFVKPFYNEAISAFAVIVSLNLFSILMKPVENAVTRVVGPVLGWIALVAVMSMLPKVRDTVYSILGGNKMSEKSLTDTFKDAKNTMGKSLSDFKNLGAKAAHGASAMQKWSQGHKATAQAKRDEERGRLEDKLKAQGRLSKFEQMRLNRLNESQAKQVKASEEAAKKQAQMDKVRNDFNAAMIAANGDGRKERAARNAYERAKAGLSKSQQRLMDKQDKAAAKVANEQVKRSDFGKGSDGDKAYKAALTAKKSELLNNDNFKKSVDGTVVGKAFKGISERARAMAYNINNSFLGEALHDYFGPDGKLANDKNSLIGAGIRMASPARNAKLRSERSAQYMKEKQEKYEALKVIAKNTKEFGQAAEAMSNAASESVQAAGASIARQKAEADGNLDTTKKLTNMYMSKYLRQGKSEAEARASAEAEINEKMRVHSLSAKTSTLDKINSIVLSKEYVEKHNLSMKQANDEFLNLTQNKSEAELKAVFKQLGGDQVFTNLAVNKNAAVNLTDEEKSKFIQSAYQQLGGDAAYDAGIAKGLKEYGVTIDMNDQDVLNAISNKADENQRLMNGGSGAISKKIAEKKEQREEDIVAAAAKLAKDLGKEGDKPTISAIANVLTSADANTSFADITKQISTKLNLDLGEVQSRFGNSYADFAQKVQFNVEIEKLENMKAAAAKWEDALKTWSDDIGDAVSSADKSQFIAAVKQSFNSDLNSTDPNSFGYKKRQIILKYEAKGGLANQQCQAEIEQLRIATQAQMTDTIAEFARKNTEKIRVHNDAKVVREAARNLYSNKAFEAIVDGYDKVEALISRFGRDTLLKDSMLQKYEDDGNLAGAGDLQMQAINLVREHKFEEVRQLGLDKATVDFFIDCEANGDPRGDLDKIYDAASYAASYLGGASGEFGGNSWQGGARATGALFAVKFKSARNEKMEVLKASEGQKESNARNTIDLYRAKTGEIFNQARWAELQGQIVDMDGSMISVGDAKGVATALQHTIDKLNTSAKSAENNEYVKHNLQVLQDWVNKNSGKPGMESLVQEANYVLECVGQATVAEQASERTDMASQVIGITEQKIADLLKKISSSGPGGK